jgi:hypothetical protein
MQEMRNAYKPERKRPLARPRCRWQDNIRMDLKEIMWEGVDWIHLAQDRDHWLALVSLRFHKRRGISSLTE